MHHGDVHSTQGEAVGRLEAQQAGADDHRVLVLGRRVDHLVGVGYVAVGDHARQILARYRQDEGVGTGGEQQAVIFPFAAVGGEDLAALAVDLDDLVVQHQLDVVIGVPLMIVEDDVLQRHLAGQDRREQDTVVVGVGFCTEYGDLVHIGCNLQQLFEGADPRHAIADHHQFQFAHVNSLATMPVQMHWAEDGYFAAGIYRDPVMQTLVGLHLAADANTYR